MTEEKKEQYCTEVRLCMSVLGKIVDEISKEKGEAFGLIITSNRYEREAIFADTPTEWTQYCNISFYDKDGHSGSDYTVEDVVEGLYELL